MCLATWVMLNFYKMLSIMLQLVDGTSGVVEGQVAGVLFKAFGDVWCPAGGEFFEGADVEVAVHEEVF